MSFTPNIPASGQTLGNSRPQVLNNFASLRLTLSNATQPNHIDVNNTGAGKHIFVQMPVQVPGSANLPAANEGGLITQTVNGNSELFYVRDAVNTYLRMTGPFLANAAGYTTLFGGLLLQWGVVSVTAGGVTVNFPIPFPNNLYSVTLGPTSASGTSTCNITASTLATLSLRGSASFACFYMAIGN